MLSVHLFWNYLRQILLYRWIVAGFFLIVLVIGLFSFRDYGVATDEGTMDAVGMTAYDYVFHGKEWATNPAWMYHGTGVELPMQILENLVSDREDLSQMHLRIFTQHLVTFLFFFCSVMALYLLAHKQFQDWRWALLCCVLLVLTPRFFAHAFYNSRDIPTLTFFTVSMYTLLRLIERRTVVAALLHGVATGLALAVRMPAMIIPVITIFLVVLDAAERRMEGRELGLRRMVGLFALYLCSLCLTTVAFWPFLWEQPVAHFMEAYRFMSSLNGTQTFLGTQYEAMPWHYIPVWIIVTVPVAFTLCFMLGITTVLLSCMSQRARVLLTRKNELLFLAWFFLPIASVLFTGAGIYNEWRHLYFIYPAFLLLAVTGIRDAQVWISHLQPTAKQILGGILAGSLTLQILFTATWMVRNHPMEFVYFSLPIPLIAPHLFPPPPDYWGLSYKQAMEFLLKQESGIISVYSNDNIAYQNLYNLHPESMKRVMRVPTIEEAMYVVVSKPELAESLPLLHGVIVDGMLLSGVYKGPVNEVLVDPESQTVKFR